MTPTDPTAAAPRPGPSAGPRFDITKQVWTFDPEDGSINIDHMWDLCYLGDPDDFPCVGEDGKTQLQEDIISCGNAIAALPQLCAAAADVLSHCVEGPTRGDLRDTDASRKALARLAAALALALATESR